MDAGAYVVLVPKSDADGNDLGCLSPPEVTVPLATFTGWNLRRRDVGAEGMLASLAGSYIPFPRTAAERRATGDPRRSIEERYDGFSDYWAKFEKNCEKMVDHQYLLNEDVRRLVDNLERRWKASQAPR